MPPFPQRVSLLYSDRDHCIAVHGCTVLSLSLQPPNPSFLKAWAAAMDRLAKQAPSICVLTVIDAGARTPDDASRDAIRATVLRHRQHIGAFAYVIEGRGFGGAAMRSCLSIISLAARYPFPQQVFANVPGAVAWTLTRMPDSSVTAMTAVGVGSLLDEMRRQLTPVVAAAG